MARINPWVAMASAAMLIVSAAAAAPSVAAAGPTHPGANRWILVAKSDQDFSGLRADISAAGGRIVTELPDIQTFVVAGGSNLRSLSSDAHAAGVAPDHLERLSPPEGGAVAPPKLTPHGAGGGSHSKVTPIRRCRCRA